MRPNHISNIRKNIIISFLFLVISFFSVMYIWSSIFQLFHAFSVGKVLWLLGFLVLFIYANKSVYNYEVIDMHDVHRTFYIMIAFELLNEIARNLAGFLHVPGTALKDIGFMLIPEFENQVLSHFGDILSFIPFLLLVVLSLTMDEKRLPTFLSSNLRIFAIYYFIRACCEFVTILPGPAPHCRPGSTFSPPKDWVEIISHMPVSGVSFSSCGDLIPSGHIGFSVIAIISILRELPSSWCRYRKPLVIVSIIYIMLICFFIIAYRKHYTVDLVTGLFISIFVSMDILLILLFMDRSTVFRDGWKISIIDDEKQYHLVPTSSYSYSVCCLSSIHFL